ncbi:MAG TPA: lasso peptide biosynthesis PqqD family chaperone [Bacteroidales bacterium]|nr:lasso peptide biosynthesis PqqD family chaperone [Bacteroidales bacterium]
MGTSVKSKEIKPDTLLKRKQDQLFSEIDGEVVMLSVENSEYYGMDKVGSRIWQLIEKSMSLKQLIGILLDEYEVAEEQCTEDTVKFIEQLMEKELVEIT